MAIYISIVAITTVTTIALLIKLTKRKDKKIYGYFDNWESAKSARKIFGRNLIAIVNESHEMELLESVFGGEQV